MKMSALKRVRMLSLTNVAVSEDVGEMDKVSQLQVFANNVGCKKKPKT